MSIVKTNKQVVSKQVHLSFFLENIVDLCASEGKRKELEANL